MLKSKGPLATLLQANGCSRATAKTNKKAGVKAPAFFNLRNNPNYLYSVF